MTKSRNRNKRSNNSNRHAKNQTKTLIKSNLLKRIITSWWKILGIIVTIGSLYSLFFPSSLSKLFQTKHEKFIEDNYISGIFAPFYAYQTLTISTGGSKFSAIIPPDGVIDNQQIMSGFTDKTHLLEDEFHYDLKIKHHRFFLSITIRDLKTGEIIAKLNDNKWEIKSSGINDYNSENLLEIIDKYGYVAFSMWVDDDRVVQMRGYYVGSNCTYFMNGNTMTNVFKNDPKYNIKIEEFAAKLKPRFVKTI